MGFGNGGMVEREHIMNAMILMKIIDSHLLKSFVRYTQPSPVGLCVVVITDYGLVVRYEKAYRRLGMYILLQYLSLHS